MLAADVKHRIAGTPIVDTPDLQRKDVLEADSSNEWKVPAGVVTSNGRIYVPKDDLLPNNVMRLFHDNPEAGHVGALTPAEFVSRDFNWPTMDATVGKYIAGCELCHKIKAPQHAHHGMPITARPSWHAHHGTNMRLPPPPSRPLDGVTMDFLTDLPESTASRFMGILVIVDQLTKMVNHLPHRKNTDSPELAGMFFKHVICKHGVQNNIVTNRGKEFTSQFNN